MKTRFYSKWAILFIACSITFGSCSNDDDVLPLLTNTDIGSDGDVDNNGGNQSGDEGEITLYTIDGDQIIKKKDFQVSGQDLVYQKDVAKHQELWTLTKNVVPSNYRTKMNQFMIFNGAANGTAGYVFQTKNDLSLWQMGLAINFADDQQELTYTTIHEFGHILTLNNDQVDANISTSSCSNFHTGEGCSKAASYINKVYQLYWADIWDEFQRARDNETAHQAFYEKYQDRFVTNYAATNPGEDIAEIFAVFVTRSNQPTGNTIADKKVQLMYDYPELVELRNYIRSNTSAKGKGRSFLPAPGSWKKANTLGNHKTSHCRLHKH